MALSHQDLDNLADKIEASIVRMETGINDRLDKLNGRTRKVEIATSVQWILWIVTGGAVTIILPYILDQLTFVRP